MSTDRSERAHGRSTGSAGLGAVARAAVRAETGRLLTLPWTWLVLAAAFALVITAAVLADVEVGVAGVAERESAALPDTFGLGWSIQVFVVLAAVTAGADLRAGEFVNGMLAVPDRRILVMARTAVLVGAAVVAGIPLVALDRWIRHTVSDAGVPGGAELLSTAAGYLLSVAVFVLLGTTLAHLLRHAMAALAILLLMPILVVPLLGRLFPRASEVLPHNASSAVFTTAGEGDVGAGVFTSTGVGLTAGQGFALLLAWGVVLIAVHTLVFVRRDH